MSKSDELYEATWDAGNLKTHGTSKKEVTEVVLEYMRAMNIIKVKVMYEEEEVEKSL